jgi:formylmethanofuran dehydrogenase subunit E
MPFLNRAKEIKMSAVEKVAGFIVRRRCEECGERMTGHESPLGAVLICPKCGREERFFEESRRPVFNSFILGAA